MRVSQSESAATIEVRRARIEAKRSSETTLCGSAVMLPEMRFAAFSPDSESYFAITKSTPFGGTKPNSEAFAASSPNAPHALPRRRVINTPPHFEYPQPFSSTNTLYEPFVIICPLTACPLLFSVRPSVGCISIAFFRLPGFFIFFRINAPRSRGDSFRFASAAFFLIMRTNSSALRAACGSLKISLS